ncbi:MAG: SUMF1/EgtB/PvdO family nonheme iron enzyme [Acidobacteria bacterium]|nr:SUMF1/EgtB/PvdO family nonheme iron enzyme [Acidobacteriota bacterium]
MNRNPLLQTIATPREERRPTVFISYARTDKAHAERLIAALNASGHACWIDTSDIPGGEDWVKAIEAGVLNSYALVPVITSRSLNHKWVRREILWAEKKQKQIVHWVWEDVLDDSILLVDCQAVTLFNTEFDVALSKLLKALPSPSSQSRIQTVSGNEQRDAELAYLDRLQLEELVNSETYTPLAGMSHQKVQPIQAKQVFALMAMTKDREQRQETRRFENAVEEILKLRRAVLLGEPGGGKTTTIWKLAAELVETALRDFKAPIPLLVRLGKWTDADQSVEAFIASQLGELGDSLGGLLSQRRAALLLDGLNELPTGQRDGKYPQVQHLIEQHPKLLAIVSCRELDYTVDLGFHRINITPLDAIRIRDFIERYLQDEEQTELLFWKLAGKEAQEQYEEFLEQTDGKLAEPEQTFWLADQLPNHVRWGDRNWRWERWLKFREAASSLMVLARNPYMLLMLTSVFAEQGKLPDNRGDLFQLFVEKLLRRESEREPIPAPEQDELIERLAKLAYEMQIRRAKDRNGNALTVLSKDEASAILTERQLYLAGSASILSVADQVRFAHQLLQEFFAAKFMDIEFRDGRLKASKLWPPDKWWERTNWEEAAILLAGLYSDDCSPVVEWVAEANPEVAAQCVVRSGAGLAEATKERLRAKWISRLTDWKREKPEARAAVGRALGLTGWDNRKGVGVIVRDGVKLPDIDWIKIPEGEFRYGDENEEDNKPQTLWLPEFSISRYPVTYAQFQTFLDDHEAPKYLHWFEGFRVSADERPMQEQVFQFANHPRDTVNWFQAMAFCRWLSWRMGTTYDLQKITEWAVRLPTEFEWEKAARGTDGRLYPYKGKFDPKKGNVDNTGIDQTSAVGMFPNGVSPYGVEEMSGNVWEWCLSDYNDPKLDPNEEDLRKKDIRRVLRGGSWILNQLLARAVYRNFIHAANRFNSVGFRVVLCASPFSV